MLIEEILEVTSREFTYKGEVTPMPTVPFATVLLARSLVLVQDAALSVVYGKKAQLFNENQRLQALNSIRSEIELGELSPQANHLVALGEMLTLCNSIAESAVLVRFGDDFLPKKDDPEFLSKFEAAARFIVSDVQLAAAKATSVLEAASEAANEDDTDFGELFQTIETLKLAGLL